jgi:serine/threonine protein phosphatase PrpC
MINLNKLLKLSAKEIPEERAFGITDIGKIRENNEDYFLIDKDKQLYIISDGMGGHNAGEIASLNATKMVYAHFSLELIARIKRDNQQIRDEIVESIKEAHQKILEMSDSNPEYKGMGCTIVVALLIDDFLHVGHIGDSRAYLSDQKNISLITTDHTYVMELVKAGKMSIDDIRTSNIKNHLSQALGAPISIAPDYSRHQLKPNNKILLCTDGLWDNISDREIFTILNQNKPKPQICKDFVRKAIKRGGFDNITAVIIEYYPPEVKVEDKEPVAGNDGEYGIVFSFPHQESAY